MLTSEMADRLLTVLVNEAPVAKLVRDNNVARLLEAELKNMPLDNAAKVSGIVVTVLNLLQGIDQAFWVNTNRPRWPVSIVPWFDCINLTRRCSISLACSRACSPRNCAENPPSE